MDWSQGLYAAVLAIAALKAGKDYWLLSAVMIGNFVATMLASESPVSVAIIDLTSAGLLINEGRRANILAFVFLAMQPIYVAGHYLGLKSGAIYTLIDLLAYVQLFVFGGWNVGISRRNRGSHGHSHSVHPASISGRHSENGLARVHQEMQG